MKKMTHTIILLNIEYVSLGILFYRYKLGLDSFILEYKFIN